MSHSQISYTYDLYTYYMHIFVFADKKNKVIRRIFTSPSVTLPSLSDSFGNLLRRLAPRLSLRLLIRLLAHPHPPLSRQQVVSLSQSSCVSPVELTDGERGESRGWARSQIIRPRESLALYKSFRTLWVSRTKNAHFQ